MSIRLLILSPKNGCRATERRASLAGRAEMMLMATPVKPIANGVPAWATLIKRDFSGDKGVLKNNKITITRPRTAAVSVRAIAKRESLEICCCARGCIKAAWSAATEIRPCPMETPKPLSVTVNASEP